LEKKLFDLKIWLSRRYWKSQTVFQVTLRRKRLIPGFPIKRNNIIMFQAGQGGKGIDGLTGDRFQQVAEKLGQWL
jgi:hypothetical protein